MRIFMAGLCVAATLLLNGVSMLMNWTFWSGQGSQPLSGHLLGVVSIGIDLFKAALPMVIAVAWRERHRLGVLVGGVMFAGCLIFSLSGAIGFAATVRDSATGDREALSQRLTATRQEAEAVQARRAALTTARPQAIVKELIERLRQDRRWSQSQACTDASDGSSRTFCRGLADLRIELAIAAESDHLRRRTADLTAEIDRLLSAGAGRTRDPQAMVLARLTGVQLQSTQSFLTVLLALLIELGAAFGLFVVQLVLRQREASPQRPAQTPSSYPLPTAVSQSRQPPTRFVRAADGQLMIE